MCFAPELRNGADLRRMEEPACPFSGQREEGKMRDTKIGRFASAADQGTWILQCNLSSAKAAEKRKKTSAAVHGVAEESVSDPKLHQFLHQMNGAKRFCFDFLCAQLLLSVSLGRSNRKNGAAKRRWRVLKSTSVFFNQRPVPARPDRLKTQIGLADPPHSSAKIWAP